MDFFAGCKGATLANGLIWLNEPDEWVFDDTGLKITAKAESDFFRPYGGPSHDSACFLYRETTGDFTAVIDVRAELFNFGDAAALTMRADETRWAKLCIERSPIGEVSLVSVVTGPWSDDSKLELPEKIMVGIHVQAPSTPGCRAHFRSFTVSPQPVEDFRSGD